MKAITKFCKNCILPDGFLNINLDENEVCDFCRDPTFINENWRKVQISEDMRKESLDGWKNIVLQMKKSQGKENYDCILGYSGGKDSTALLDMLVNEYHLSVLALTIDTGLMTEVAKQNIQNSLTKLEYSEHHLFIENASSTFIKLYRYMFLNQSSQNLILTGKVCDHCSDLIHSIMVKEAIKREIPFIILGYSSDQIKRYFFEIPETEIRKEWNPSFIQEEPFTGEDRNWFLTQEERCLPHLPRIVLPYHVLDYNEDKIIAKVTSQGLIENGKSDPVLTNCHVVKAALIYDFYRYGGLPYGLQYAELVRQADETKKLRVRKKWLRLYKSVAKAILNGNFAKSGVNTFFSKIGVSKQDLLEKIANNLEKDPNKDTIKTNLELFR